MAPEIPMEIDDNTDPSLGDQLLSQIIDNERTPKYLPVGALERLMTDKNIRAELDDHECISPDIKDTLVDYIRNKARKCFATLIFMKMVPRIEFFRQCGLADEYLPFEFVNVGDICKVKISNGTFIDIESPKRFYSKPQWDKLTWGDFIEKQWRFLAPVFTKDVWQHEFHKDCPMPFLMPDPDSDKQIHRETLFSDVRQWRIHSDHIKGVSSRISNLIPKANFRKVWT